MAFIADYKCHACGNIWEDWTGGSTHYPAMCPECGVEDKITRVPGGNITTCHDPQVRSEKLKKRSAEHSIKTAGENIERLRSSKRGKQIFTD